jgi:hypothetical protein
LLSSTAGEAGIAVFRVAFGLWVGKSEQRSFGEIVSESLARLRDLVAIK